MPIDKLPLYVNLFPDGQATLTCAHCAVDAQLEGARATALYTERRDDSAGQPTAAIIWQSHLTAEEFIVATRRQCAHLADYGPVTGVVGERPSPRQT